MIETTCDFCGKQIRQPPKQHDQGKHHFCCAKHYHAFRSACASDWVSDSELCGHPAGPQTKQHKGKTCIKEKHPQNKPDHAYGWCSFSGCGKPVFSSQLCRAHYGQMQKGLDLRPIDQAANYRLVCRQKAERKYAALAGSTTTNYNGLAFEYTGRVATVETRYGMKFPPELKCEFGHAFFLNPFSALTKSLVHHCPICVTELGGLKAWDIILQVTYKCGLSVTEYLKKRNAQKNDAGEVCCAICNKPESENSFIGRGSRGTTARKLSVDHRHDGARTDARYHRALLCTVCNMRVLGPVEGNPFLRRNSGVLTEYLDKWDQIIGERI